MYNDTFTIETSHDTNTILFMTRKFNILNAKKIEENIIKIMSDKKDLVLDFNNVKFIDSTGFTSLHKIKIKSYIDNTNVRYININPELKELFNLVGFN